MTASLYQRGSPAAGRRLAGPSTCAFIPIPRCAKQSSVQARTMPVYALQKIVEIALRADPAADAEDVGGGVLRIERHEVAGATPEEAGTGEQVVHLEGGFGRETQ